MGTSVQSFEQGGLPAARRSAQKSWLELISDHNPFYLLSALCMLGGCVVLSQALWTSAGSVRNQLILLGVINVYELLLIGLALALIRRRGLLRDGILLLGLEALFLSDITFLNGIISTIDPNWGTGVAALLLALAIVKAGVVLRGLRIPNGGRILLLMWVQLALLMATPIVFKRISIPRDGNVPLMVAFIAWWCAALPPIAAALVLRRPHPVQVAGPVAGRTLPALYLAIPFFSLLLHVYSSAWVYKLPFLSGLLAPACLGLAVGLAAPWFGLARRNLLRWQVALAIAAIVIAPATPAALRLPEWGLALSPLRLALMGAVMVFVYASWLHRRLTVALLAGGCLAASLLGPSWSAIFAGLHQGGGRTLAFLKRLAPRTAVHWGVVAVGSSFVLLGVGAWVSFRKPPASPADEVLSEEGPIPEAERDDQAECASGDESGSV